MGVAWKLSQRGGAAAAADPAAAPHTPHVLIYVQSCRGVGHFCRVSAIAAELCARGASVTLVSGGLPLPRLTARLAGLPRLRFVQLPMVRAAEGETWRLVDEHGEELGKALEARRREVLLRLLRGEAADGAVAASDIDGEGAVPWPRPDALLIEMFPFGRRRFHFELEPMLEAAYELRPRPAVLCSVRDVLVAPGRGAHRWAADKVDTYLDRVLVHGEEALVPFDRTFECFGMVRHKVSYTGCAARPPAAHRAARRLRPARKHCAPVPAAAPLTARPRLALRSAWCDGAA